MNKFLCLVVSGLVSSAVSFAHGFGTGNFAVNDCARHDWFKLEPWNGVFRFEGTTEYGNGSYKYPVSVVMEPVGHNILRGRSTFVVPYGGGYTCGFPYEIELRWDSGEAQYFVQYWTPNFLPNRLRQDHSCADPAVIRQRNVVYATAFAAVAMKACVGSRAAGPMSSASFDWGKY